VFAHLLQLTKEGRALARGEPGLAAHFQLARS